MVATAPVTAPVTATTTAEAEPSQAAASMAEEALAEPTLEHRIQQVLDDYRPTLYMDGGDVELLHVDAKGIAHIKMLGACIDCPISLLTMKLGIQRLLKEHFPQITGINAVTDVSLADLYDRDALLQKSVFRSSR